MGNVISNVSHPQFDLGGGVIGGIAPAFTITATTVSQDQIDVAWSASAGQGIVIERAASIGGPFTAVYYADDVTASVSLYSHQPATEYFFRARRMLPDGTFSSYSATGSDTTTAAVNTYYVATTGNDTTGDGSSGTPWKTIQRGVWDLTAGDVLNIAAGTYTEAAEWPASLGGGNPTKFDKPLGVVLVESGTATAPIIIQATGAVILDQLDAATGFHFHDAVKPWPDYIHIKGIEHTKCTPISLWSVDRPSGAYGDADSLLSRGVVLEGNNFHDNTFPTSGANSSAVRMDSNKEWVVRNNVIDAVAWTLGGYDANGSGCLYAYNIHPSSVIEFNTMSDGYTAIHWKHTADNVPAGTLQSTIRYNRFTGFRNAVYMQQAGGTGNPGLHNINHNIYDNVFAPVSLYKEQQEARVDFRNNWVNYNSFGTGTEAYGQGVSVSISTAGVLPKLLKVAGNIFTDTNNGTNIVGSETNPALYDLEEADYNIFEGQPDVKLGVPAPAGTLAQWQAYTSPLMSESTPGAHSREGDSISTLATNTALADYTIPVSSPALAFMADSSNAGPYQFGNSTVIGVIS